LAENFGGHFSATLCRWMSGVYAGVLASSDLPGAVSAGAVCLSADHCHSPAVTDCVSPTWWRVVAAATPSTTHHNVTHRSLSHHLACVRYAALPTMLWCCWLGVRKSVLPVKIEWWGVGVVICVERGADCLRMVLLIPLHPKTTSSLALFKSRVVLPFCVGKEAVKRVL